MKGGLESGAYLFPVCGGGGAVLEHGGAAMAEEEDGEFGCEEVIR